jgi:hypothetical protein
MNSLALDTNEIGVALVALPAPSDAEAPASDEKKKGAFSVPAPDENLPVPANLSKLSTHQVSYLFNKLLHKEHEDSAPATTNQKHILKEIAQQIISSCSQLPVLDSATLSSLPPLALMDDADTANELLRVLVEKIGKEAFLDRKKLQALSLVVHYGGSRLDPNFVLEALSLISKNLQSIRVRAGRDSGSPSLLSKQRSMRSADGSGNRRSPAWSAPSPLPAHPVS